MQTAGGGWTLVLYNGPSSAGPAMGWNGAVSIVTGTLPGNLDASSVNYLMGLRYWEGLGATELMAEVRTGGTALHKATMDFAFDETTFYTIQLSNPAVLVGATLPGLYTYHNNRPFSTLDADHDSAVTSHCATLYGNAPWWYGACFDGSFWGGAGSGFYPDVAYWTGSTTDWGTHGLIWVR
jgi:hypothetical protein